MKELYHMRINTLIIPILPETLKEMVQMDNKKYDTFGAGEMILPGKAKLHTWTISSYFPRDGEMSPSEYKKAIDGLVLREYENGDTKPVEPVKFVLGRELENGTMIFEINTYAVIDSIEWEDRKGEPGDLYYTIKLTEYKRFGTDVL